MRGSASASPGLAIAVGGWERRSCGGGASGKNVTFAHVGVALDSPRGEAVVRREIRTRTRGAHRTTARRCDDWGWQDSRAGARQMCGWRQRGCFVVARSGVTPLALRRKRGSAHFASGRRRSVWLNYGRRTGCNQGESGRVHEWVAEGARGVSWVLGKRHSGRNSGGCASGDPPKRGWEKAGKRRPPSLLPCCASIPVDDALQPPDESSRCTHPLSSP